MTKTQILTWLRSLSADESKDYYGKLCLINVFYCLKERLVSRSKLKLFLADCVKDMRRTAIIQFARVCSAELGGRPLYFGLRQVDLRGADPNEQMMTVIEDSTFRIYMLSRSYKSISKKTLPIRIKNDDDERLYTEVLKSLQGKDWSDPGKNLGKPVPEQRNCWFTTKAAVDALTAGLTSQAEKANAVRDALGLVQRKVGDCLVSVTFPAGALKTDPRQIVAQPTFADGVNQRFAAFLLGAAYRAHRLKKWGTAANLGKFESGAHDICGLEERVSNPLLIAPRTFPPGFIGSITKNRGESAADHEAFANLLLGRNKMKDVISYVVSQVTR